MDREWLKFLREQYPKGSRITLKEMKDPFSPVEPGMTGTLDLIDDSGTFHVKWDNGRTLGVVVGEDSFSVRPPRQEPTTLKLYMPLNATLYAYDDWGDLDTEGTEMNGMELTGYEDQIRTALEKNRMPEEAERGIMHWYDETDSVNDKVQSVVFGVESRNNRLWGVAECRVYESLSPSEMGKLKDYITGQASDGWGEGFEQREIKTEEGNLYVSLWDSDNSWEILTEQERFTQKVADGLPELCFSTLKSTGQLICIKRGETGYYPSDASSLDKEANIEAADSFNERLGVTPAQRQAMEVGSMFGWDVPGADPASYELKQEEQTQGEMQML